jgi:hypothetical protein
MAESDNYPNNTTQQQLFTSVKKSKKPFLSLQKLFKGFSTRYRHWY